MKPIKVGIIANEFFDPRINRVGGFGWAARQALKAFRTDGRFAPPVYFCGEQLKVEGQLAVDGTRIVPPSHSRVRDAIDAWRQRVDVLLCIDYRPNYLRWLRAMPFTPVIVWVRDPRTGEDMKRLKSLRIPGSDVLPGGVPQIDFGSLGGFMRKQWYGRRRIVLASKMAYMHEKIPGTFGLPPPDYVLPNPDVVNYAATVVRKSARPTVVSLGRLDPVKRPWLFLELAKRFPDVVFLMMGKGFVSGPSGWQPGSVPPNVKLLGNVEGQAKLDILSSAWVLVNTSIHEESAVSMMEALAYEVTIISYIESDQISARFGICLGYDSGTGLESVPRLANALKDLLDDEPRRRRLGEAGRDWVRSEHTTSAFIAAFTGLCEGLGVRRASVRRPRPVLAGVEPAGKENA